MTRSRKRFAGAMAGAISVLGLLACTQETSIPTTPPDQASAQQAIIDMLGPAGKRLLQGGRMVLGTCLPTPARFSPQPGQFSCTFLLKSPGGSSESQADFYYGESGWVAQPSMAQEILPFPDAALTEK